MILFRHFSFSTIGYFLTNKFTSRFHCSSQSWGIRVDHLVSFYFQVAFLTAGSSHSDPEVHEPLFLVLFDLMPVAGTSIWRGVIFLGMGSWPPISKQPNLNELSNSEITEFICTRGTYLVMGEGATHPKPKFPMTWRGKSLLFIAPSLSSSTKLRSMSKILYFFRATRPMQKSLRKLEMVLRFELIRIRFQ